MCDFRQTTVYCLGRRFSKHKITRFAKNLGVPPDYAWRSVFTSGCKEKSLRKAFRSVDLKDALLLLTI